MTVAVAASGGRDSTALLHCTLKQALPLGVRVLALHVHHGLQPQANHWLAHVRAQARRWGADFDSRQLAGAPARGDSVEAWARRGRYAALVQMAQAAGCGLVLLGQHRRDQAETVLLQALRGAGPAGLAAMPVRRTLDGVVFLRPWLALPREAIEAYVRRHRLGHVEDNSNDDPRYSRNRLRQQLWPAVLQAFPEAENALRHTAQRCAEARQLAEECAAADLALAQVPLAQVPPARARPPQRDAAGAPALGAPAPASRPCVSAAGKEGTALQAAALRALSQARRRNLLRSWLASVQTQPVPETLVRRLADEMLPAVHASWPGPGGQVQLRRGMLVWLPTAWPGGEPAGGAGTVPGLGRSAAPVLRQRRA